MDAYDYRTERVIDGGIALIALIVLVAKGSWLAFAVMALCFADGAISRAIEILEYKVRRDSGSQERRR